ncbi:helix-turn-helix domain-containing protein [Micromonospora sp. NPDC007271]|uniref:TetR/AcrR family transcriptional regulator n=1 Tax=Micromonospora sp. NPDC007271 TaxID=3154587 RepID=UPI003409EC7F
MPTSGEPRDAGVGKGSIYLHWRSREQLFFAVGTREAVAMLAAVVAAMREDPQEIALHRYMRRFFLEAEAEHRVNCESRLPCGYDTSSNGGCHFCGNAARTGMLGWRADRKRTRPGVDRRR